MHLRMQPRSVIVEKMAGIFTKHNWQPYTPSDDSRMKNVGAHCGAKEKVGGNINIYLAW